MESSEKEAKAANIPGKANPTSDLEAPKLETDELTVTFISSIERSRLY